MSKLTHLLLIQMEDETIIWSHVYYSVESFPTLSQINGFEFEIYTTRTQTHTKYFSYYSMSFVSKQCVIEIIH